MNIPIICVYCNTHLLFWGPTKMDKTKGIERSGKVRVAPSRWTTKLAHLHQRNLLFPAPFPTPQMAFIHTSYFSPFLSGPWYASNIALLRENIWLNHRLFSRNINCSLLSSLLIIYLCYCLSFDKLQLKIRYHSSPFCDSQKPMLNVKYEDISQYMKRTEQAWCFHSQSHINDKSLAHLIFHSTSL